MDKRAVLVASLILACGCINRNKDFVMTLNRELYVLKLGPTTGEYCEFKSMRAKNEFQGLMPDNIDLVDEGAEENAQSYGYAPEYEEVTYSECCILFPAAEHNPDKWCGFRLTFDPREVTEARYDVKVSDSLTRLAVTYTPLTGHDMYDTKLIDYASDRPGGEVIVVFDSLDIRDGGRVAGRIEYAKLSGMYLQLLGMTQEAPKKDKVFEMYNFPFDVRLREIASDSTARDAGGGAR